MTASYENLIYLTAHDLALNLTSNVINQVPNHRSVFIGPTDPEVTDFARDVNISIRDAQLGLARAIVEAISVYFGQSNVISPKPLDRYDQLQGRWSQDPINNDLLYLAYNFATSKKNSVLARVSPVDFESAMRSVRIAVGYREETNWAQGPGFLFDAANPMRDVGTVEIRFLAKVTPSA